MMTVRPSSERGHNNHGWLDTYFTFSFADYYDPAHMGYRSLRVINEDRVVPGAGFPTHPHNNMEIVTYVLKGAVAHKDSMGNEYAIPAGEVQRMTAGTGVTHSEYNASESEGLHLLQIWILPQRRGLEPSYEQRAFSRHEKLNQLRLIAGPDGTGDALTIHQDAKIYASVLESGHEVTHALATGRGAWVHVARGAVTVEGEDLRAGDGASVEGVDSLTVRATQDSEILLFDLA